MAYWGPPFTADADQARFASLAALDMLERVRCRFGTHCRICSGSANVPISFDIRIGIATGEALVGSIGSEMMMSYTVMGETVNLASRLEGATNCMAARILVSAPTASGAGAASKPAKSIASSLLGQTHAQPVYEIMGRSGALTAGADRAADPLCEGA